jgi:phosphorylase kinase alpha/beta subunit
VGWVVLMFANIECEWPLFFCYMIIDNCFRGNKQGAAEYTQQLEDVRLFLSVETRRSFVSRSW